MSNESERMQILELIESGKISAEEGIKLLQALEGSDDPGKEELPAADAAVSTNEIDNPWQVNQQGAVQAFAWDHETIPPPSPPAELVNMPPVKSSEVIGADDVVTPHHPVMPSDTERWRKWWMIPLWVGVGVTIIGAVLMFFAWRAAQLSFWFACAWIPFLMGIGVMAFALASSRMRWLHLRVYQKSGDWPRKISFSFPLPIRFIAWLIRVFGRYSKDVRDKGIDQILMALEKTNPDEPFFLEVDDDEDGNRVEIYIG